MAKKKDKKQNNYRTGMTNYPVGDFLIRVKNACLSGAKELVVPKSKLIKAVAEALEREAYIDEVKDKDGSLALRIAYRNKEPIIMDIKLISKPGLRIYMGADELENKKGPTIFIVSTPKGVMTSRQAVKERVGGEVIAEIL